MHENERAAPVVNTSARRIPAADVMEKLAVGFMEPFLSTCMSAERARIRHFSNLYLAMCIGANESKSNACPTPVMYSGWPCVRARFQMPCIDEVRTGKFPGSPRITGTSAQTNVCLSQGVLVSERLLKHR